jgi:hypothetical protein
MGMSSKKKDHQSSHQRDKDRKKERRKKKKKKRTSKKGIENIRHGQKEPPKKTIQTNTKKTGNWILFCYVFAISIVRNSIIFPLPRLIR